MMTPPLLVTLVVIAALTFKVAPEATVTGSLPNALLLEATNVPLLVTTTGMLKDVLAPLNTKVPASATNGPYPATPEIVPDSVSVLPL
jgi:hypothetical protein